MSKSSEAVIRWRKKTKQLIVEAMGGRCQICHYFTCEDALELHHIDPNEKEMSFGRIRANPQALEKIAVELAKCILLCCRCHREYHAGMIDLPEKYDRLDVDFLLKSKNVVKERRDDHNKKISKSVKDNWIGRKDEMVLAETKRR